MNRLKFCLLIFLTIPEINSIQPNKKFFQKKEVSNRAMSSMASIRRKDGMHLCGGCLISKIHVLTAAHCIARYKKVKSPKYNGIYIVVNCPNLMDGGTRYEIKHLDYYDYFYDVLDDDIFGDIGLLTVNNTKFRYKPKL